MVKVYKTDSGHEMDGSNFFFVLLQMVKDLIISGKSKEQSIKIIWEDQYFGDNIINQDYFMAMKNEIKNLL